MKKNEKLKLIEGAFTFDEAKEILNSIFSSKLQFHDLKNWSSQDRFGKEDKIAQKRIPALKNEIVKLEKILSNAKNKKLMINSEIKISIIED